MHLRRQLVDVKWPITRKGTAYIVRTNCNPKKSLPLLLVMRDMLKVVNTSKELKKILNRGDVNVNGRKVHDVKSVLNLFDSLTIIPSKEHYRLNINEKGKFFAEKISEKEAQEKITKVTDKKILNDKKIQINCIDGFNFLTNEKVNTDDSVVIDFKTRKIAKVVPLRVGANARVIRGRHIGQTGKIEKADEMIEVKLQGGKVTIPRTDVIIIE